MAVKRVSACKPGTGTSGVQVQQQGNALIDVLVVFLFTKPMVTLLAGTRFYGGGHRWSGLDPARLGAKAPWRSSTR